MKKGKLKEISTRLAFHDRSGYKTRVAFHDRSGYKMRVAFFQFFIVQVSSEEVKEHPHQLTQETDGL